MNKALASAVALFLLQPPPGLLAADTARPAHERKIDIIVIAEQSKRGEELAKAVTSSPPTYAAYDAGYVEAGDPIAGEHPPSADVVADRVRQALDQAGFRNSSEEPAPTYVIIYSWGLLRPERRPDIGASRIDPNLKQRLSLVAPWHTVSDLEQEILTRRVTHLSPTFFVDRPSWRDAFDYAHDPRFFLIVTAFEGRNVNNTSTPLWRTTLSTQETRTSMAQAIPTLAAAGASYFGKDFNDPHYERPVVDVSAPAAASAATANMVARATAMMPSDGLRQLLKKEHDRASGEFGPRDDEKGVW